MSEHELARLRLRILSLTLWHGCDLKELPLRGLDFGDTPLHGGQVGGPRSGKKMTGRNDEEYDDVFGTTVDDVGVIMLALVLSFSAIVGIGFTVGIGVDVDFDSF